MSRMAPRVVLLYFVIFEAATGFELPDLKGASDDLINIVRSDKFDNLFSQGKSKLNGLKLLRHIGEHSSLHGENFETLFRALVGAESLEDLQRKKFSWKQATDAINAIVKLSDSVSVNESRKPNSKYRSEDERITAAKKFRKEKREQHNQKQEL